jgi:hypothetical protein
MMMAAVIAMDAADHGLTLDYVEGLAGNAAVIEKALALIRWQPVQWHAIVSSGGAVTRKRTLPQRQ